MRVIHVATGAYSVPPTGAGGVERVIYSLTQHLSELGYDVSVIDIKAKAHQGAESKVLFHEVWNPSLADKGLFRHIIRVSVFAILALFKLRRLVKSSSIDIIHTHSQFPAVAVLLANRLFRWNIPHVHTIHNSYLVMCPTLINRLKHILEVIVLKKATHIVALTDTVRGQLISSFGVDSARITVIPNGVEVEDIIKFIAHNPRQTGPGKMVFCPARICARKNQLAVLQAAPEVLNMYPETKFIFVGPIEERPYFNSLSKFVLDKNLSHAVEFAGEVSRERLYDLYQNATVFALPTLYEAHPLVVLEAMSFGLPVVASRIGPIEDVVKLEEGSAILIDFNKPDEIAGAIIQIFENEELRQELSARGKKLVLGRFSWRQIAAETLKLYDGLKNRGRQCQRQ
jgi:glycosyltransferase involved in cell wall biosynthesis